MYTFTYVPQTSKIYNNLNILVFTDKSNEFDREISRPRSKLCINLYKYNYWSVIINQNIDNYEILVCSTIVIYTHIVRVILFICNNVLLW